jgi:thymidylate synthase ThyX
VGYRAEILLDSVSYSGDRLLTYELTYPRFIHAEMLTHRALSRSSASSRAIPVAKMLRGVEDDPVIPVEFGLNQSGMQAEVVADAELTERMTEEWLVGRSNALRSARALSALGAHKQICNRILEPFSWITVVVTATDWGGFFRQRASRFSPLAQPEFRRIADMMLEAHDNSTPRPMVYGDWHTPYILADETFAGEYEPLQARKRVSAARCARTSYLTQRGDRDHSEDLRLYERLVGARPRHLSPFEHVATPVRPGVTPAGNLCGWRQMRHDVDAD